MPDEFIGRLQKTKLPDTWFFQASILELYLYKRTPAWTWKAGQAEERMACK
jgi:hypothetical protein